MTATPPPSEPGRGSKWAQSTKLEKPKPAFTEDGVMTKPVSGEAPPSEPTNAIHEFEEMTLEPESMNVGQLNHIVRRLRERVYQNALKHQSALASQEARHQKALDFERETVEGLRKGFRLLEGAWTTEQAHHRQEIEETKRATQNWMDKYEALLGERIDHGWAMAWQHVKEAEAKMEEAKRERDEWKEKAEARLRHIDLHMKAQGARSLIQQRTALVARAEAAEQREREAVEREKVLREALAALLPEAGKHWSDSDTLARIEKAKAALAAIRSATSPVYTGFDLATGDDFTVKTSFPVPAAPSPVSAPPTQECARCGRPLTKAEGGDIFTVCDACWDAKYRPDLKAGASPVEPGSDPQESEK